MSTKPSSLTVTVFLVALGVLFLLLPYAAMSSRPSSSLLLVAICSIPSLLLVSVGIFGSKRVKRLVAEYMPWFP
jgi:uncharacterized membrane protein YccC